MFYLADFKRRYEKWLDDQPDNKSILIPELNTANKSRKVSEVKTVIKNARKTNLKKGRNKSTKTYIDSKQRLRKYTGGNLVTTSLTPRQKRIQELATKNKENYLRKQANKILTPSDRPLVSFPKKVEIKTPKQEAPKVVQSFPPTKEATTIKNPKIKTTNIPHKLSNQKKEELKKVKNALDELTNVILKGEKKVVSLNSKTQIKNPVTSEPTQKTIAPKVNRKLGRKVLTGLGVTALGVGALYGLNRLRKTRKDKGKKRGTYKK
jgi:hypothetical protein